MSKPYNDEFEEEVFDTILMIDEEGEETEFAVIDHVSCGADHYLLVVESELLDDDETDAIILKEIPSANEDEVTYILVEDDAEFAKVADLFSQNEGGEYDVQLYD